MGFDDLEKVLVPEDAKVFDSYSEAQAQWLVRVGQALKERSPDVRLVLTPHEYYSNHPEFATDLAAIAKQLPEYWDIGWTGKEIVSRHVTKEDADGFNEAIGRHPILGDNYPVNDMQVLFNGEWYVHLGPLEGRDAELPSMLPGVAFNASADTFGALPALASVADYVWNPKAYEPERAMKNAAYLYGGPHSGAAALELLASNCRSPDITDSVAPALEKLVDELWTAWDSSDKQAYLMPKGTLAQELARFRDLPDAVKQSPYFHPGLLANIQPHIDRLGEYGRVGLMALSALQSKREGKTIVSSITDEITALIEASGQELAPMPTGEIMPAFLERALEELLGS
jgi:hyaluronoglucosaminidase